MTPAIEAPKSASGTARRPRSRARRDRPASGPLSRAHAPPRRRSAGCRRTNDASRRRRRRRRSPRPNARRRGAPRGGCAVPIVIGSDRDTRQRRGHLAPRPAPPSASPAPRPQRDRDVEPILQLAQSARGSAANRIPRSATRSCASAGSIGRRLISFSTSITVASIWRGGRLGHGTPV